MTPGFASVASAAYDHNAHPVAGVAITFPAAEVAATSGQAAAAVRSTATHSWADQRSPSAVRPRQPYQSLENHDLIEGAHAVEGPAD